jgi:hypothetical protein
LAQVANCEADELACKPDSVARTITINRMVRPDTSRSAKREAIAKWLRAPSSMTETKAARQKPCAVRY